MKAEFAIKKTIFVIITAVLITAAGIYYHQSFFRMFPLYNSLIVYVLMADVNRIAYLLAAANAVLYAWVFYYYGLYASTAYALFISAPSSIITFVNWRKNSYRKATVFRKLTGKNIIYMIFGYIIVFILLCVIMTALGSNYTLADNFSTAFGIMVTVLTLLRYQEYAFLMIPYSVLKLILYIIMLKKSPEQLTYVLFTVYMLICSIIAWRNAKELSHAQASQKR